MNRREQLYEGKAKKVYATDDHGTASAVHEAAEITRGFMLYENLRSSRH